MSTDTDITHTDITRTDITRTDITGSEADFDVDRLLAELTLAEKASLTSGSGFWYTAPVERLGIPKIMVSDGPHGLRAQPSPPDEDGAEGGAEGGADHIGLGSSLPATCFPTASAVASAWNPALLKRIGSALAQEARACNLSVILGPGVNMKRSPLCGRNFEYFSEDPFLAGELGVGIVDGIQSGGIGTSLKHYAANNQETDRLRVDAQVDERTLREIYLPAFERVVTTSQPWTVMCSYNKVNGRSASQNPWLLQTVLRDEFGFRGLVVSDWGAVYDRVPALQAGTDLEMPPALGRRPEQIVAAVEAGTLDEATLDTRVRTVLELVAKGRHGLELDESYDADAHHALAREAAAESIVLLDNDGILPLPAQARIAVVGEFARTPRFQGAGSSQVNPTRVDVLLDELRSLYGEVPFAGGYRLAGSKTADLDANELLAEAERVAAEAEVVVMVIGLPGADESEGFDRTHLDLPADQLAALKAVAAVNPNVVVVLVNGSTVVLGEVTPYARALVEAWLGGQAAGGAIADVLSGAVNPSGKLAETVPLRLEDNSATLNFPGEDSVVRYGEGVFIGYRGYDRLDQQVGYPFGHGLSYTSFALSDLEVELSGAAADGTLAADVTLTVTNTGEREGAEVVQVYVQDVSASVARPVRELKGFAKVQLAAGASSRVRIALDQRAFSFWASRLGRWTVEAGEFVIAVGSSSRDLPLSTTLVVDAPHTGAPLEANSTLQEWIADPSGRELIQRELGTGAGTVLDPELFEIIGNMPMSTLANFTGMSLDHAALERVAAEWAAQSSSSQA